MQTSAPTVSFTDAPVIRSFVTEREMSGERVSEFAAMLDDYLREPAIMSVRGTVAELVFYRALWYALDSPPPLRNKSVLFVPVAVLDRFGGELRHVTKGIQTLVERGVFSQHKTLDGYLIRPPAAKG